MKPQRVIASASGRTSSAIGAAMVFAVMLVPLLWSERFALTILTQFCIAALLCFSYRLLLSDAGLLSFGHAIFSGLGAFFTMRYLAQTPDLAVWQIALLPLYAACCTTLIAALIGLLILRYGGAVFAMMSLGLSELIAGLAYLFPQWSGGEAGMSANRVGRALHIEWLGVPVWTWDLSSAQQMYALALGYLVLAIGFFRVLQRSLLMRSFHAVRDQSSRVVFLGYAPKTIRLWAYGVAAFFAGLAGGLYALVYERVTYEVFSLHASAVMLLFTVLGGMKNFYAPFLGATLGVLAEHVLPQWTSAWMLYVGLAFMGIILFSQDGLWGLAQKVFVSVRALFQASHVPANSVVPSRYALRFLAIGVGVIALVIFIAGVQWIYRQD